MLNVGNKFIRLSRPDTTHPGAEFHFFFLNWQRERERETPSLLSHSCCCQGLQLRPGSGSEVQDSNVGCGLLED